MLILTRPSCAAGECHTNLEETMIMFNAKSDECSAQYMMPSLVDASTLSLIDIHRLPWTTGTDTHHIFVQMMSTRQPGSLQLTINVTALLHGMICFICHTALCTVLCLNVCITTLDAQCVSCYLDDTCYVAFGPANIRSHAGNVLS